MIVEILTLLGALAAGAATAVEVYSRKRRVQEVTAALSDAKASPVDAVLDRGDLQSLGNYLYDTLGRVPLSAYADDEEARSFIAGAVENVGRFTEGESAAEGTDFRSIVPLDDLLQARQLYQEGHTWEALARLRRGIEVALKKLADHNDIPTEGAGGGRVLMSLTQHDLIASSTARALRQALGVANRVIHGDPVTEDEVGAALAHAERALNDLALPDTGKVGGQGRTAPGDGQ